MKGTISNINKRRGMVAVKTIEGSYSIFELLSNDEVEVGDQVEWAEDTVLGDATLKNQTQGTSFEVYFQNHHVNQSFLDKQLRI